MNKAIFYFDIVDSTNDEAKKLVENFNVNSGLVISDCQNKGRGRFGNTWISMKGNFMGSVFFPVKNYQNIEKLQYSVLKILLKIFSKIVKKKIFTVKEPNDILVKKKKVSGIVIESFTSKKKLFAVIGIGINFLKNPAISKYKTTNFKKEFNKSINKLDFAKILTKEIEKVCK